MPLIDFLNRSFMFCFILFAMSSLSNKFIALLLVVTIASLTLNVFLLSTLKHSYVTVSKGEYGRENTSLGKENERLKEENRGAQSIYKASNEIRR